MLQKPSTGYGRRVPGAARYPKLQYGIFLCILSFILITGSGISARAAQNAPQAAVTAGLASGMGVADIIKDAVSSGMSTEQAVSAMVAAGADPGIVVYNALNAGYPAESVVKGAAAAGYRLYGADKGVSTCAARVCEIISAADQFGSSENQIHRWIVDAGVPAVVVANAGAQSCRESAPVEGYSAPNADLPMIATGSQSPSLAVLAIGRPGHGGGPPGPPPGPPPNPSNVTPGRPGGKPSPHRI